MATRLFQARSIFERFANKSVFGVAALLLPVLLAVGCSNESVDVSTDSETDGSSPPGVTQPVALSEADFDKAKFLFFDTCAGCHGALRKGATGPELSPKKILKLGQDFVRKVITQGTPKGMPPWGVQGILTPEQVVLLGNYLAMPPPEPPMMNLSEMMGSWKVFVPPEERPTSPQHERNWENFFGVILRNAGKVAIIDGDTKERVSVMETGFAVHILRSGPDGRYFYVIGRDAKASLIDLWLDPPQVVAEVKVGIDARSIEISKYSGPEGDLGGKYAVIGCYWPPHLVVVDGQTLEPIKVVSTSSYSYDENEFIKEARVASIVASHHSPEWIVCVKESGYVWLVDYSNIDSLKITQVAAERYLHDGGFDSTKRYFLVAANQRDTISVIDAQEGKLVNNIKVGVKPHPGRGANFIAPEFGPVWATGHIGSPDLSLIGTDPENHPDHAFKEVQRLTLPSGGSLFLKTHPQSNHLWVDHPLSSDVELSRTVAVFDRRDLSKPPELIKVCDHGKAVHIEYDKSGKEVWVSAWDVNGEIVIYDDETLEEKHRITGDWVITPTGKFNVYNTANDTY